MHVICHVLQLRRILEIRYLSLTTLSDWLGYDRNGQYEVTRNVAQRSRIDELEIRTVLEEWAKRPGYGYVQGVLRELGRGRDRNSPASNVRADGLDWIAEPIAPVAATLTSRVAAGQPSAGRTSFAISSIERSTRACASPPKFAIASRCVRPRLSYRRAIRRCSARGLRCGWLARIVVGDREDPELHRRQSMRSRRPRATMTR